MAAGFISLAVGVALLAEGVDRNNLEEEFVEKAVRRPPRGGRG